MEVAYLHYGGISVLSFYSVWSLYLPVDFIHGLELFIFFTYALAHLPHRNLKWLVI